MMPLCFVGLFCRAVMFEYLSPRSQATSPEIIEYLELHQAAQEFRLELEHRAKVEAYCQWYYQVAAENQRDFLQMRSELDLLAWVSRRSIADQSQPLGPDSLDLDSL